ncbi:hypothetical protein [Bacillus mesophilum]|uniref:Uncharacterized protein n=1 Tax=Bacillus mesophilum TaxID=1071718 RepID=A0A7V7UT25_9BACI|nr:hypothetical protein [Bacillus mesophilum]KAB2329427.1 hypothetical protein F7732_21110 [Bacillus mesophilum]
MRKKSMSEKEANAYKVQAEGKAALVAAWVPFLTRLVTVAGLVVLALLGMDAGPLKPVLDLVTSFMQ